MCLLISKNHVFLIKYIFCSSYLCLQLYIWRWARTVQREIIHTCTSGFHTGSLLGGEKINHVKHIGPEGGGGVCSPRKCSPSEVASGGFFGPRWLVAEMLLHVEANLVWNLGGRELPCYAVWSMCSITLIRFVFYYSYHNRLYLHYVSTLYQLLCY